MITRYSSRRDHLDPLRQAGDVAGEHGNAGVVGFLDGRADRLGIARTQDDGGYLADEKILDLILLASRVELAADHEDIVAVLLRLGLQAVGDLLEKRVRQRQHR